jgi:phosphohistidine phosphatase
MREGYDRAFGFRNSELAPPESLRLPRVDLWLLRHAEPEERAASGRDEDRRLTETGQAQAEAVGRGLAALSNGIALVLTSPYARARQTAEAVAKALGVTGVRATRALEPDRDPEDVLSEVEESGEEAVLLVGHAPLLGHLLGRLVSGDSDGDVPLSKASAAWLSLGGGHRRGRLLALLPATLLERLAKER